jgi:hypothetical protein
VKFKRKIRARVVEFLGAVGFIGDWPAYRLTIVMLAGLVTLGVLTGRVPLLRATQLFTENTLVVAAIVFVACQAERLRVKILEVGEME